MLRRYLSLSVKDMKVATRNYFLIIVLAVAVLMVVLTNFVIPDEINIKPTVYYGGETTGNITNIFNSSKSEEKLVKLDSRKEIIKEMKSNKNSIGIFISFMNEKPKIEFITQGNENQKVINSLRLSIENEINKGEFSKNRIPVEKLKTDKRDIPFNKSIIPTFLVLESSMLGLIMIAAFIFIEKSEGTLKAYKVSPGGIHEYIASKLTLMVILGVISTLIITVFTLGTGPNYLYLLLLIIFGNIFATSLGLIIGSFFRNISQAMIWIILVGMVFGITPISYLTPNFSPMYIRLLPTYQLLYGVKEALFPTGDTAIIMNTLILHIILAIIGYILTIISYKRNLLKY